MTPICLVLRAHLPRRLRAYNYFDVGRSREYLDDEGTARQLARADALWLAPALETLEDLVGTEPDFRFALALSGPLLVEIARRLPARAADLRRLVSSGGAEPLASTVHHSLRRAIGEEETALQLGEYRALAADVLGREPRVFGGEEPADADALARLLEADGFAGMVLDGGSEPPRGDARRRLHGAGASGGFPVLVGDSPATARRRRASAASETPRSNRLLGWLWEPSGDILCAAMDLSSIPAPDTAFARTLRERLAGHVKSGGALWTPSDALRELAAAAPLPERAGLPVGSNELQRDAHARLAAFAEPLAAADAEAAADFRVLTSSDHFDAMSLAAPAAGPVDDAAPAPYETYMAFRHALADAGRRLEASARRRGLSASAVSPA